MEIIIPSFETIKSFFLEEYADPNTWVEERDELVAIYNLIRITAPGKIVELGRGDGFFTITLLAACQDFDTIVDTYGFMGIPPPKDYYIDKTGMLDRCNIYIGNDLIAEPYPTDLLFINLLHEDGDGNISAIEDIAGVTSIRLAKWLNFAKVIILNGVDYHPEFTKVAESILSVKSIERIQTRRGNILKAE